MKSYFLKRQNLAEIATELFKIVTKARPVDGGTDFFLRLSVICSVVMMSGAR